MAGAGVVLPAPLQALLSLLCQRRGALADRISGRCAGRACWRRRWAAWHSPMDFFLWGFKRT